MADENRNEKEKARRALEKDFGREGLKDLLTGAGAIVDITNKMGMPYKEVEAKIRDSYEKGLVKEKDGLIIGFEKKEEKEED